MLYPCVLALLSHSVQVGYVIMGLKSLALTVLIWYHSHCIHGIILELEPRKQKEAKSTERCLQVSVVLGPHV